MISNLSNNAWNILISPLNYMYRSQPNTNQNKSTLKAQNSVANLVRTPQSGYHYEGFNRRFFEGWYFRVLLPNEDSFAIMYSVEDPIYKSKNSGTAVQVMGPKDGYIVQHTPQTDIFWGNARELELGATFQSKEVGGNSSLLKQMVDQKEFREKVQYGFQASYTLNQGKIRLDNGGVTGDVATSNIKECEWNFTTEPKLGWGGDKNQQQKSTAGWLSNVPLLEPQWQVLLALGKSTGSMKWGDKIYEFQDAPTYAEKNWGGGFPQKWFWVQCNSFKEDPTMALTGVGALRGLLNVPIQETVGLIGLTYKGKLIQISPYEGEGVKWDVEPWGHWKLEGEDNQFKINIECKCSTEGAVLRAPTQSDGLAPACKDSFYGKIKLILQEKDPNNSKVIINTKEYASSTCACEVGGGPWWYAWKAESKYPFLKRQIINPPFNADAIISQLPKRFQPFGF